MASRRDEEIRADLCFSGPGPQLEDGEETVCWPSLFPFGAGHAFRCRLLLVSRWTSVSVAGEGERKTGIFSEAHLRH